ncbi:hypothetical protein RhiirA5_507856 [Rhizophagus irregularis]|uniref:SAM domain-containing protein n=1 Tax=Rhizophagus irregularis TaxID=588596 RepID=A0A2N0NGP7_9GLOM|nr:hypothetical protein RhiirA5_507856 [Rhizophagus irregularis]
MSSQASSPASPASITEEVSSRTNVGRDDIKILRKEKISDLAFLELTEEKFRSIGLALGPTTTLAKFIEGLSQKATKLFLA